MNEIQNQNHCEGVAWLGEFNQALTSILKLVFHRIIIINLLFHDVCARALSAMQVMKSPPLRNTFPENLDFYAFALEVAC